MGVKGLTTYINQNSHRFLSTHELCDCNLVIDGNNLACQLYRWYGPHNSAYGGDYDRYSESVISFFQKLKLCNVTAYVIMDGGYEIRKLRTISYRLRQKISAIAKCTPAPHHDLQVFPVLMKQAFKDVLRKCSIPLAQCDFEADDEIAAVARKLGCPVLSYDSDFYIYNVPYIPFGNCEVDVTTRKNKDGRDVCFIKCKIYHVEGLVKHFGGLDSSLLPLMAVLLGNDYVKSSTFKKFFLHVKLPASKKMSQQQKKIAEVIEWLKKETVESALIKILSKFKKERRAYLSQLFQRSIKVYSEEFSNTLKYLGLSGNGAGDVSVPVPVIDLNDKIDKFIKNEDVEASDCEEFSESMSEHSQSEDQELKVETSTLSETNTRVLPPWLLDMFRCGLIDSSIANIFHLARHYCDPQVEDFTLTPTYKLSFPILAVIFGLIVKSDHVLNDDEEYLLRCYGRNDRGKPCKIDVSPVTRSSSVPEFCNLSSLDRWPKSKKLSVLLDTMTFTKENDVKLLYALPEEWRLYAMAIVYWGRQNTEWPHVTNCHIHALVLGIISLDVVDSKVGYYRNTSSFLKKYGSHMRKAQVDLGNKNRVSSGYSKQSDYEREDSKSQTDSVTDVIDTCLRNVSLEDCLFLEEKLIDYHQGKSCVYSLTAVHSFGQMQSCLNQAMSLNALLSFPVPQCSIANFYSGKFVTSVYADLSKRSNLEGYLDLVMVSSPAIRRLHKVIAEVLLTLMPNLLQLVRKGKNKRKKKAIKKRGKVEKAESNDNNSANTSEGEMLSCVENRFSVLSIR